MRYILDFDDTLFDTKRFKESVKSLHDTESWATPATWNILDAKSFLFDDTLSFLSAHQGEVTILTAFNPLLGPHAESFQKAKLEQSGVLSLVDSVLYVQNEKGEYVKNLCGDAPSVFVDDKLSQHNSVKTLCPDVILLQMVRPGLEGQLLTSNEIPVIHSLSGIVEKL